VIDRARLGNSELKFDESFTLLEDYDFVLRLFAAHEPDFALLDKPVCEYRIRLDGSNSIAHTAAASPEVIELQQRAWVMIKESKKNLYGQYFSDKNINDFLESTTNHAVLESGEQAQDGVDRDRRVLLKIVLMMYDFFSRYPRLELRLSKTLHLLWGMYKKLNHSASHDKQR
jgi:hypothetical protein